MNDVHAWANGGLKLHCGKQKAAVAGDRDHLFARAYQRCRDSPGQSNTERLLAIADKYLPCTEAVEMPRNPEVERAHVQAKGDIGLKHFLKFCHKPQGVDWGSPACFRCPC
jgi:hypothetical protein